MSDSRFYPVTFVVGDDGGARVRQQPYPLDALERGIKPGHWITTIEIGDRYGAKIDVRFNTPTAAEGRDRASSLADDIIEAVTVLSRAEHIDVLRQVAKEEAAFADELIEAAEAASIRADDMAAEVA